MYVLTLEEPFTNVTHHAERDLMGNQKNVDPGQPALSTKAETVLNFLL